MCGSVNIVSEPDPRKIKNQFDTAEQEHSNEKCGKCNKIVRNGIFCEGRCQKWSTIAAVAA